MRLKSCLALAVGIVFVAGTVHAASIDLDKLTERGKLKVRVGTIEITFETDDTGKLSKKTQKIKDRGQDIAEFSIDASIDPDPFIGYGLAVTNFTAGPLDFLFSFTSPYIDGPYNIFDSSHSSSVTDGGGGSTNDLVTVSPTAPFTAIHLPSIDGVAITAANLGGLCTVNPPGGGGGSDTCFSSSFLSLPVSTLVSGTFGVDVRFTLSAFDTYTGNGRIELRAVPDEASTALLLGLAIGVMFLVAQARMSGAL